MAAILGNLVIMADRWTMCRRVLAFPGFDLTGADLKMEIRTTKDTGSALVTLNKVTTDVQGVRVSYAFTAQLGAFLTAGRLSAEQYATMLTLTNPATGDLYQSTDVLDLSHITIRINEAIMESLVFPSQRGNDLTAYWDLHVTPSGGDKEVWAAGDFIIRSGVTQ